MYDPVCVALGIEDPTALHIPYINAPLFLASSTAANVSAVSPDWEIAITTSPGLMTGFRYRNSEAYSTSTGKRQNFSMRYFPIRAACQDVPHATIINLFAEAVFLYDR